MAHVSCLFRFLTLTHLKSQAMTLMMVVSSHSATYLPSTTSCRASQQSLNVPPSRRYTSSGMPLFASLQRGISSVFYQLCKWLGFGDTDLDYDMRSHHQGRKVWMS